MSNRRRRAGPSRRTFLGAAGAAGLAGLAGCSGGREDEGMRTEEADSLTVLHGAGLAAPFTGAESAFEQRYSVGVTRERRPAVTATQRVAEADTPASVLGVSAFQLLRDHLLGAHADWYVAFATDATSVLYRSDSPGAGDVSTDGWWEVLSRDGVRVGHADPAVHPAGVRAVLTQKLGRTPFEGSALYDRATYRALRDNSMVVDGPGTALVDRLEAGELDYAIAHRSLAAGSGVESVDLQPSVDLSRRTRRYVDHYASATVETDVGTLRGAPAVCGLTVPSGAPAAGLGAKWAEFTVTQPGREHLREAGLTPLETPVVPERASDAVPERVMLHAEARQSLDALAL